MYVFRININRLRLDHKTTSTWRGNKVNKNYKEVIGSSLDYAFSSTVDPCNYLDKKSNRYQVRQKEFPTARESIKYKINNPPQILPYSVRYSHQKWPNHRLQDIPLHFQ